jgi:hypothetical protein
VLAFEGVVYGGFIRDMLSGIMFNDIDINIDGGGSRMKDFENVVRWMVSSALGLPHRSVQFEVFDISPLRVEYLQLVTTYIISVEIPDAATWKLVEQTTGDGGLVSPLQRGWMGILQSRGFDQEAGERHNQHAKGWQRHHDHPHVLSEKDVARQWRHCRRILCEEVCGT